MGELLSMVKSNHEQSSTTSLPEAKNKGGNPLFSLLRISLPAVWLDINLRPCSYGTKVFVKEIMPMDSGLNRILGGLKLGLCRRTTGKTVQNSLVKISPPAGSTPWLLIGYLGFTIADRAQFVQHCTKACVVSR
jgi:hypothetical protein